MPLSSAVTNSPLRATSYCTVLQCSIFGQARPELRVPSVRRRLKFYPLHTSKMIIASPSIPVGTTAMLHRLCCYRCSSVGRSWKLRTTSQVHIRGFIVRVWQIHRCLTLALHQLDGNCWLVSYACRHDYYPCLSFQALASVRNYSQSKVYSRRFLDVHGLRSHNPP